MACGPRIIEMPGTDAFPQVSEENEEKCIVCGHCVAACSTGALSHKEMTVAECVPILNDLKLNIDQAEQFLKSRRSIRTYRDKAVEKEKLKKVIDIASYAPSGHNSRPVHWIVVEDTAKVRRLTQIVVDWMEQMTKDSPEMAELMGAEEKVKSWENGVDRIAKYAPHLMIAHAPEMGITPHEDCILSLSYLELAAMAMGLGATWLGYMMFASLLCEPFMRELRLPEGHKCFGVMGVGYPKFKFRRIPSRPSIPTEWR